MTGIKKWVMAVVWDISGTFLLCIKWGMYVIFRSKNPKQNFHKINLLDYFKIIFSGVKMKYK